MDKFARLICGALVLAMSATAATAADAVVDTATIASYGDPDTALKRIGPQARRGNARAEALLGYMYEHGLGVPQSWPAAVDYYLLAAEQGDATGQYLLGLMYDKGFGVSRDVVQAYKWLNLAASHGPKDNRPQRPQPRSLCRKEPGLPWERPSGLLAWPLPRRPYFRRTPIPF